MPRAIAHYLPREMAILGLVETALSFAAIYAMIPLAGESASLPGLTGTLPHDGFALAAILTLVIGAAGLTIGLNRKRLLTMAGLAATVAFAVLLALSGEPRSGFTIGKALSIAPVLGPWLVTMTLIRLVYGFAVVRMQGVRRILLLGEPQLVGTMNVRLRSRRGRTFDPIMLHAPDISCALLREHRIWGVIVVSEPEASAIAPLLDCKLRGVKVLSGTAFHEEYLGRIDLDVLTANELLMGQGFAVNRLDAVSKRIGDIILGLTMLVLTLPLTALTALAIKIDSSGPVFYRQQRSGQFDKPFTLFKFRSMTADAEAAGSPRWAQKQDPRVTRVGRFIRATRIDELPQLANVILGEMSMVGPRPERPHFVEQLARAIPFYRQRSYVKPGLTGWAQVNFPYGASVEDAREKLAYDLYYAKNRSLVLDASILLSTIRVVLYREGAR
jgi:exopolysaccharide biosynthesis polyprenyl glycosylphosphotransferase